MERKKNILTFILFFTIFFIIAITYAATPLCPSNGGSAENQPQFKIAILFENSSTGNAFAEGIRSATRRFKGKRNVDPPMEIPYADAEDGLKKLLAMTSTKNGSKPVDVLLGPTGSAIFARAKEKNISLDELNTPVISFQVSGEKIPATQTGPFFHVNINTEERARLIANLLNKYWIRSIALFHGDNELGKRAKNTFQQHLGEEQKKNYQSTAYNAVNYTLATNIRDILQKRPEALGVFGDPDDLVRLLRLLRERNAGLSGYSPLVFSLLDVRPVKNRLSPRDTVFFVSGTISGTGTRSGGDERHPGDISGDISGDMPAAAFHATMLLLEELDVLAASPGFDYRDTASWQPRLRDRLKHHFGGKIDKKNAAPKAVFPRSTRIFDDIANPRVFKVTGPMGSVRPVKLGHTRTLGEKLGQKVNNIVKRFGYWPLFNVLLISVIIGITSVGDMRRWYIGKKRRLFKSIYFWMLIAVNTGIAMAAYIYLGETGNIRYDSVLTACILALGPPALFRGKLFETAAGKTIELAKYYDQFLLWIYERMTIRNYFKRQVYVNLVAYHNSVYGMKSLLREIYRNAPNQEQYVRVVARIEGALKGTDSWIDRRKAMARLLLLKVGWQKLVALNFVHERFRTIDPETCKIPPRDPEEVLMKIARHCATKPLDQILINEKINDGLAMLAPERQTELVAEHEKDMERMKTPTAGIKKKITFFFLLHGYDPDFETKMCGLRETKQIIDRVYDYCSQNNQRKQQLLDALNALTERLTNQQTDPEKTKYQIKYQEVFQRELADLTRGTGTLKKGIAFLFGYNGWKIDYLEDNDFLPRQQHRAKQTGPIQRK